MNYREEIIELVGTITQEHILQFFYALLRVATSDPDAYEASLAAVGDVFGIPKEMDGV